LRRNVPLVVPFAVQEVGETARTHVDQLVEDGWDHGLVMDLKVQAGVGTESHELLKDETGGSLEDGVDDGEDQAGVSLALVLIEQDGILDVEVRLVVLEVDILGQEEGTDDIVVDLAHEGEVG
jgi:hypothetical protein